MDVSPELLREIEFRERWRGYDPDEVDDLLERMAIAVEQMQEQLRDARSRAGDAAPSETGASEGELRRTLVLAQRTAAAAVKDAEAEAVRILDAARAQVESLDATRRALQAHVDELRSWLESAPAVPPIGEHANVAVDDADHEDEAMGEDPPAEAPPAEALDDDPFFAELRRAVTDAQPLGPREDGTNGAIGPDGPYRGRDAERDEAALAGGRFRLRRRR